MDIVFLRLHRPFVSTQGDKTDIFFAFLAFFAVHLYSAHPSYPLYLKIFNFRTQTAMAIDYRS